ncbi:hypothetical protein [Streptomyces torulosus]|uniref:hypothetical protein n=1 Tax=Streptomyces torulosus TaxID=68276 RepID=UPI001F0AD16C|nr:hypothetical protein [Streptomyces torulosus]
MKNKVYQQVKELMTQYGKVDDIYWGDGWPGQHGPDADAVFFWEPGKLRDSGQPVAGGRRLQRGNGRHRRTAVHAASRLATDVRTASKRPGEPHRERWTGQHQGLRPSSLVARGLISFLPHDHPGGQPRTGRCLLQGDSSRLVRTSTGG